VRFAVVACSACGQPWAVETRHAKVSCPDCGRSWMLADRARLWQGDDAASAADAAARLRAGSHAIPLPEPRQARHDSPEEAAAAKARGTVNKSRRAEEVATWMTRLVGQPTHAQLLDAMGKAGLDRVRAEREVGRMLAMDYLTEQRAGTYRVLDS
jgi:uncharacterized Zn finger protein (UPF0148 family)